MRKFLHIMEFALLVYILALIKSSLSSNIYSDNSTKRYWTCDEEFKCQPIWRNLEPFTYNLNLNVTFHKSHEICRLICGRYGALWPLPTKVSRIEPQLIEISPDSFNFEIADKTDRNFVQFMESNLYLFDDNIAADCPSSKCVYSNNRILVEIQVKDTSLALDWDTNESYQLIADPPDPKNSDSDFDITIVIKATTAFGARHALETLSQLVAPYKDYSSGSLKIGLVMTPTFKIIDKPQYAHRGLNIDTSRNYLTLFAIKRQIDAMAYSKMNVLHWHATDSQSFPILLPSVPQMARYGAYSEDKIYALEDIADVLAYAKLRGVRVIFELDMPSHAGNGWQWGPDKGLGNLAVCVNKQPWRFYCIQPPCGQLNPINDNVINVLQTIFTDLNRVLNSKELFHMGGDEVHFGCWNSTPEIVNYLENNYQSLSENSHMDIWGKFQEKVKNLYDSLNENEIKPPSILWSSRLTEPDVIEKYLDKDKYIIQTWVRSNNTMPKLLLNKGYRLIISTKNAWYLDHGFWGNTKYQNSEKAYNNKLPKHENVLGGEVCMWGEYIDSGAITGRIWPRAAAAAERLWSDPNQNYRASEARFLRHRERLVSRGIAASATSPYFCYQNEGQCGTKY